MKRPEKWYQLPRVLWDGLISNSDLYYDVYEGSHEDSTADLIHHSTNENGANWFRVQQTYTDLDDAALTTMVEQAIESTEYRLKSLKEFLDSE